MKYVFALIFFGSAPACALLTPADRAVIDSEVGSVAACEDLGRACKADAGTNCYSVYDNCMKDAGLH